jgi:hypothetical protein
MIETGAREIVLDVPFFCLTFRAPFHPLDMSIALPKICRLVSAGRCTML